MKDILLTWFASLRMRMIITYLLVTVISFGFLLLLLMNPVQKFLMKREEDKLAAIGVTLGSTIRDPWSFSAKSWETDLVWTQRRCVILAPKIGARIRMLDARGNPLTDVGPDANTNPQRYDWAVWKARRMQSGTLKDRPEVARACVLMDYQGWMRPEEGRPGGPYSIYIAMPIKRRDPAGRERLAFIIYLNKSVAPLRHDINYLRNLFLVGTVASLLVTVLVAIVFSSNLSARLRSATQIARDFAAGNMDQRMPARGRDEVGQLGAAFNQMADALQRQEQLRRGLLADVSHELRTPLAAISGCADTLADGAMGEDPAAAERFLGIILHESARLKRLVSDILELSRLQAGAVVIPVSPVAIFPLVEEAVEIARLHARTDNIRVVHIRPLELANDSLLVLGHEDRIAQALRNLLDNARHHTPAEKTVMVSVEPNDSWVVIRVRDEGEGIPPEDLPWVFDRFYRAGKGEKPGGTGLGLAIVREIMHALGGRVTVDSTVGEGATFCLYFRSAEDNLHLV